MRTSPGCRSCGGGQLTPVLSLGQTPLANSLLKEVGAGIQEERFPLDVVFCRACSLVQITETVPPEKLYRDYVYFSSFSDTMLRHAEELARRMIGERGLNGDSRVVEIASNDGYLLQHYHRAGVQVLGIEPARNVAAVAREKGLPTLDEFFGLDVARRLRREGLRADVFHAHNVLAHVADLNGVVAGVAELLADSGEAVIEVPYVRDMIEGVEFDTIYHEHLCYFSLTALSALFARHGLSLHDAEHVAIHGGSLRLFVRPQSEGGQPTDRCRAWLHEEREQGLDRVDYYRAFGSRVERLKVELCGLLARLKSEGKRLAAYGASAKGSTLLNYFGIGAETLEFVADRSTVKQGRYTPGTHLPICSPDRLLELQPDCVLLLTWNFAEEILAQQAEYRSRGGRFIIPIPEVRIV